MTRVTVLTQPDCALCRHAETVLARIGQDHPLDIDTISLDTPAGHELAVRHAVAFAPGVLLEGALFSYGRLSERRLRRHLATRYPDPEPPPRSRT